MVHNPGPAAPGYRPLAGEAPAPSATLRIGAWRIGDHRRKQIAEMALPGSVRVGLSDPPNGSGSPLSAGHAGRPVTTRPDGPGGTYFLAAPVASRGTSSIFVAGNGSLATAEAVANRRGTFFPENTKPSPCVGAPVARCLNSRTKPGRLGAATFSITPGRTGTTTRRRAMKPERIQKQLQAHPRWTAAFPTQQLIRNYSFPSFRDAVRFVNLVARSLGKNHHHIELTIRSTTTTPTVTLALASFTDSQVTDAEFALAGVIDEALELDQADENLTHLPEMIDIPGGP